MHREFHWPNGKKYAAVVSVNLDAEYYGRIYYPGIDVDSGEILSIGRSGMQSGLSHLLDVFRDKGVKATFFVPGKVAEKYPRRLRDIAAAGHEISCHGYEHEIFAVLDKDEQKKRLALAKEAIESVTGSAPLGFRMPEGEISLETLEAVKETGFLYSSSLSDTDCPYIHEETGLPELPIRWELFDLPFFTFAFDPPIPPGSARCAGADQVLANWQYELAGARKWGSLYNLQIDPQGTGEQGRLFILETILDELLADEDVWLTTGAEMAQWLSSAEDRAALTRRAMA